MDRLKRGFLFWALLLIAAAMPVSAQKTVKKQLYHANIATASGSGVGSTQLVLSTSNPTYMVRTSAAPGQVITRVSLTRDDGSWGGDIVLCDNSIPSADACTYDGTGNIDIEGAVVGPMFPPGVTGGMFVNALTEEHLQIRLNDGASGTGVYFRIM